MPLSAKQVSALIGLGVKGVVANYAALPLATSTDGFYWVEASQGTSWLPGPIGGTYYPKGLYYSPGGGSATWEYYDTPYQALQVDVDAGTITNQFVSPLTFTNASKWGTKLTIASNLSDLASAATARVNLGQDKRTANGDSNYSILVTDKEVVTFATFTASRNWTLPDASTVNAGYEIIIADEFQGVTSTNTLVIKVQTGQKLNGITNGTETISSAGSWRRLISNGTDGWVFDAGLTRASNTQTLTNKTISGSSNTFSNIPKTAIVGGYQTLRMGHTALGPTGTNSYFFGANTNQTANTASILNRRGAAAVTGFVYTVVIQATMVAGSSETGATIKINNKTASTSTTVTNTIAYDATGIYVVVTLGTPFAVTAGDQLEIEYDNISRVTQPTSLIHTIDLIIY